MNRAERSPVEKIDGIDAARQKAREVLLASTKDVNLYVNCRRTMETALTESLNVGSGSLHSYYSSPQAVVDHLGDFGHPSVRAAFLMAAVAHRAAVYAAPDAQVPSFSQLWNYRQTRQLARESQTLAARLLPKTQSLSVNIDLLAIRDSFWESINRGGQERIIITGLDGSGKTTVIKSLTGFLERLGLRVAKVGFPRPDSPSGALAKVVLKDEVEMDDRALQFLMVADALDFSPNKDAVLICDRHPATDTLVYGPPDLSEVVLLAARELLVHDPHWLVIINRHPVNCFARIQERRSVPERFEQGVAQMVDQTTRLAGLTALPGTIWVNTDIPTGGAGNGLSIDAAIALSGQRVVAGLASKKVIPRALVRQGICQKLNEAEYRVWDEFKRSWRKKLF